MYQYCKCNKGSCKNLHLPEFLPTNPCKFRGLYQQISAGETCNLQPSTVDFSRYPLSANISSPSPQTLDRVHPHTPGRVSVHIIKNVSQDKIFTTLPSPMKASCLASSSRHGSRALDFRWLNPQKGSKM